MKVQLGRDEEGDIKIEFPNGESLRFDSSENNPNGVSFVRFYDREDNEVVGWVCDEWREDPELVMGSILGKLCAVLQGNDNRVRKVRESV